MYNKSEWLSRQSLKYPGFLFWTSLGILLLPPAGEPPCPPGAQENSRCSCPVPWFCQAEHKIYCQLPIPWFSQPFPCWKSPTVHPPRDLQPWGQPHTQLCPLVPERSTRSCPRNKAGLPQAKQGEETLPPPSVLPKIICWAPLRCPRGIHSASKPRDCP